MECTKIVKKNVVEIPAGVIVGSVVLLSIVIIGGVWILYSDLAAIKAILQS